MKSRANPSLSALKHIAGAERSQSLRWRSLRGVIKD
jgi:hypothetical protein